MCHADAPADDRYWCPELETARRAAAPLQQERVILAYQYLWECSSFYRAKFERAGLGPDSIRTLDDLPKIPVTRREEWLENQEANPPWGTFSPLHRKTGPSGAGCYSPPRGRRLRQPRVFRHTTHDRDLWSWLGARALYAMGARRGDIAINCFGYGTSVAFWGLHYALNLMGVPVISGGGANTERRAFFHPLSPDDVTLHTVLRSLPGRTDAGCRPFAARQLDPHDRGCRRAGTLCSQHQERIEDLWHASLHDDFGCTEVAMSPLGYTCREQVHRADGQVDVHLMEDAYLPEVLHPETMQPVGAGESGVLVVSNLFSESQPILRYVMGDWISVTTEPCLCGRTHARAIGGLKGRNDELIKIRGLMFFPSVIEDAVRRLPEVGDEFKIEIRHVDDMDRIKITVEPNSQIPKGDYATPQQRIAPGAEGFAGHRRRRGAGAVRHAARTEFKAKRLFDLREKTFNAHRQLDNHRPRPAGRIPSRHRGGACAPLLAISADVRGRAVFVPAR